MNLIEKIKIFHEHLNFIDYESNVSILKNHHIEFKEINQLNKNCIKIRAFHFIVLSSHRTLSSSSMFVNKHIKWQQIERHDYYYEKELTEFALQCLYLSSIPLGECTVQRTGKKEISIIDIRKLDVHELTNCEVEKIEGLIEKQDAQFATTFGTDLEIMFQNVKSKKYINVELSRVDERFGFDEAIALHKNRVFHPIFEVRPKPASSMEELHQHLLQLYHAITNELEKYHLLLVTNSNPVGRFFLGGHIHFGNALLSYKHVQVLDQFLAIPYSLIDQSPSVERRRQYGRLGSIRLNRYQGFEYRVLPTWFQFIPEILPVLKWVEYLIKNANVLMISTIPKKYLENYYNVENEITINQWSDENNIYFPDETALTLYNNFVECLKKLS